MPENPLKPIETLDPELMKLVDETRRLALGEGGALPRKVKFLIALALDASHGAAGGVNALAHAAMHCGATREEIAETLRIAFFISGVGSTYTAAEGLGSLIK